MPIQCEINRRMKLGDWWIATGTFTDETGMNHTCNFQLGTDGYDEEAVIAEKIKEIEKDVAGGAITEAIGNFKNLNADKFKNPYEPDNEIGLEAKTTVDNAKKWVDASDGYATYEEPNPQT